MYNLFKYCCILICLLIAGNKNLIAQTLQNSETTSTLNSVYFVDVNNGWAVGLNGTILKTSNGGENWQAATYNGNTEYRYNTVFFINNKTGWISGNKRGSDYKPIDCILLKTTDGGNTWNRMNYSGDKYLRFVQFASDSIGWIVENVGFLLPRWYNIRRTDDGGKNWTTQLGPIKNEGSGMCMGLFFLDKNTGFAIDHGRLLKTVDGGVNWNSIYSFENISELKDLFFLDSNQGWVTSGSKIYKTSDGGLSWIEIFALMEYIKYGIGAIDNIFLFNSSTAVMNSGWDKKLFMTTDGGAGIEIIYSGIWFYDFFVLDEQNCWAVGKNGKIIKFSLDISTGFENQKRNNIPEKIALFQNYPNPFNPNTTIKYSLNKSSNVILKIYNLAGQELETLAHGFQTAGEHEITWQPKGLPSGIYYYRLQAGPSTGSGQGFSETKKLILQK